MKHLGITLMLVSLPVPAKAQIPSGGYQTVIEPTNVIDPGFAFSSASRTRFGQIAGLGIPGAVTRLDGDVYGIFDPLVHKSIFLVEQDANDFDLIRPATADGPAGIVMALSDGLWLYELVPDTDPLTDQFNKTQLQGAPSFDDLDMVRAADLDGLGRDDLMVVDGTLIRVLVDSGSGWLLRGSFDVGSALRDLLAVDWDSNSSTDRHIAVLLDQSVQVWVPSTTSPPYALEETFPGGSVGGHLALIPDTTVNPGVRLAYGVPVNGVGDFLLELSPGGGRVSCGMFSSTAGDLESLVSAVFDRERVDLMAPLVGEFDIGLYEEDGSLPSYNASAPPQDSFENAVAVSGNDGSPAFGDISFDWIPDGLVANATQNKLFCYLGRPANVENLEAGDLYEAWLMNKNGSDDWVQITVNVPASIGNFTHWQALLWRSADGEVLAERAISNLTYPIGTAGETQNLWMQLATGPLESVCGFSEIYAVEVRAIQLVGGTIQSNSAWLHGAFGSSYSSALQAMNSQSNPVLWVSWLPADCPSPTGGAAFIPLPSLPPITDNAPPQIPTMGAGSISQPW